MMTARYAVFAGWLLVVGVPAQGVTVQATALTDIRLEARSGSTTSTAVLPQGSDMTSGASLTAAVAGFPSASASLELSVEETAEHILVRLHETGSASIGMTLNEAQVDLDPHRIQVDIVSPRPMRGELIVRSCSGTHGTGSYTASLEVPNQEVIHPTGGVFPLCQLAGNVPVSHTLDVLVEAGPFPLVLETASGFANSGGVGPGIAGGGFDCQWEIEFVPDPDFPAQISTYGAACGATLNASSDLLHPGIHVITMEDTSAPFAAVLSLGQQRQTVSLPGGCTLYHDLVALSPWSVDASGRAMLLFDPPAGFSGLKFQVQGATLGTGLHTTNGLEITLR